MNKNQFLIQPDVRDFVKWLGGNLPTMPVHLKIKRSNFVPQEIDCTVQGIEEVQAKYQWGGDWEAAKAELRRLRIQLRLAIRARDELATYAACEAILAWGNVDGAVDFLKEQLRNKSLVNYLKQIRPLLALDGHQCLSHLTKQNILRFDSGMTKIHSLLDTTGSPIYDGRVGAAIALLYHMYRQASCANTPVALDWAWGPGKGAQIRDPKHLKLGYEGTPQLSTGSRHLWARRQLQLGWIIREVLRETELFAELPRLVDRCHAFEAGLFMLGYDLRCLVPNGYAISVPSKPAYRVGGKTSTTKSGKLRANGMPTGL
ncbi:MAG: hypothetical protein A3G29_07965 [Burkholderiales bacterium RIFCSPLOWO2_12_FULL_64_99]|jgi:hypothetical protein|nr:MAG: hypothetical protein A3E52_02755 [Burkholderiales bacterium RIFCSPHIGHO2_12_FULL_63_20]OGB66378.1 MAG: hypothetical protein A3G29_07965 [Burkholderiales bacterium RIFCSPLOWO2_12_FULL_64_99]